MADKKYINKKPGIYYAQTADGTELPIIDITNPAFTVNYTKDEMDKKIKDFVAQQEKQEKMPAFLRNIIFPIILRNSVLGKAITDARSGFLSGMNTYLMKLGSENLGSNFTRIDREIAGAFPSMNMRLRLQETAEHIAISALQAMKANADRTLYLISIAGGTAMETLNALILLNKKNPELFLSGRRVIIHVLEFEKDGPEFCANSLKVLQAPGAPLHGLNIEVKHDFYDWTKPEDLQKIITLQGNSGAIVIISSEGALFEYGTDDIIKANLSNLAVLTPADAVCVGTITPDDGPIHHLKKMTPIPTIQRALAGFTSLAESAGWKVTGVTDCVFSKSIAMKKNR